MKLSKLKLWNYRCFGSEEQVILIDQLTTFIGNNSAGKTAALSALNCMFSENSNDRILHRSDFHLPKDILPDEMEQQSLYIEAVFEFEELQSGSNGGEYFFLNRGKPSTHIAALSQLSDEELKENVPPVLQRLIETADHILKGDKNENCAS